MEKRLPLRRNKTAILALAAAFPILGGAVAFASPDLKHRLPAKKSVSKKAVSKPTLYVVGYSHLDTQWCWTYPQVIREFIPNTLHENFNLFEKYPDYVFNWTGSNRYRFMKEYYPEDYAKLKKYIAAKRWFTAGSSIEEGDVNSPSEESLIRQVMYGNEFFRKEFGTESSEYMLPDCFGFPASLPSILAHCGLKGFSTQKLTWGSAVGIPFNVGNWVGPDGRSVVAALNATSYGSNIDDDLTTDRDWNRRLGEDAANTGVPVDYRYFGVGDRGGSPEEIAVKNLEVSLHGHGPLTVVGGRADQMFNDLSSDEKAKLPNYKGDLELTQHSAGSLTSEATMKRWNRKNELLADATEKASVAADWLGALPYDKARITDAWLRFLPGQFHDLMAGTALPLAYTYTWNDEVLAMNEFAGVFQSAVGGVAATMETQGRGIPVVVVNPLSTKREDVVEASVAFPGHPKGIRVVGPDGKEVAAQLGEVKDGRTKVVFVAKMAPLGFAVYDVRPTALPTVGSELKVTTRSLENSRYLVAIDDNGDVSRIYDKTAGRELLKGPARLAYLHENPENWPSWNMDWADQRKAPRAYVAGKPSFRIVEEGPARVAVEVTRTSEGSVFRQTIRLASGDAGTRVEFANKIDWQGKESVLKAEFPLTVSNPLATYNWELGTVQRGNDDPKKYEVASHRWSDLTDASGDYGVSILDDSKYGSDKPNDSTMRLSLLYTPGTRGGYQHQGTQDWGRHEIVYAVEGHAGSWGPETQWSAMRLNQPLVAFQTYPHAGPLGKIFSLASVSNSNVSIEALKKAEDGDEIIVRTNELAGMSANDVKIKFAAPIRSAREVDGQEREIGPARIVNGELVFSTTAYLPKAFAIRLGPAPLKVSAVASHPLRLPYDVNVASTWAKKTDGDFDGKGDSLPGELLPSTVVADNVTFKLAPAGGPNAIVPNGQQLPLPAGKFRRVYLLAASADGDTSLSFGAQRVEVPAWNGYIGQWDTRLWSGVVPELTYDWHNEMTGLVPGFIKRTPVAWYADHLRLANGKPDIYAFAYLFRLAVDVPDDMKALVLPKNEKVRILAATVATNPNDDIAPAQPLYDVLDRSGAPGPTISPAGGTFSDATPVRIGHSLYWSPEEKLHYTLDGSTPTLASPVVSGELFLTQPAHLRVAQVDANGKTEVVSAAEFDVRDTTAPSVVSAVGITTSRLAKVVFSEPVAPASATDVSHYSLEPANAVSSAKLAEDGRSVALEFAEPLAPGTSYRLTVNGVTDLSPAANVAKATVPLAPLGAVFTSPEIVSFDGRTRGSVKANVAGLPTGGADPWTINMFVYIPEQLGELTLIAGFGSGRDDSGQQRFLVKFHDHIHFWGSNVDITASEPFDVGKWQMVTISYDGKRIRIYKNGSVVANEAASLNEAGPDVRFATRGPWEEAPRFAGKIAGFTIWNATLPPEFIKSMLTGMPK